MANFITHYACGHVVTIDGYGHLNMGTLELVEAAKDDEHHSKALCPRCRAARYRNWKRTRQS